MRRPLISAVTVLLLVGAAGCSSSASSSSGGEESAGGGSGSGSSSTVAGGGSQSGGSPSAGGNGASGKNGGSGGASAPPAGVLLGADSLPSPAADHCRTKNLTAVARGTGQGRASVVITNKGDGSCTVRGFPSLLFISEGGRTELPVDWAGAAADATKLTLAPGDSAAATLTFTSLDECEVVTGLDVVPPGESRSLTPAFTTTGGKKKAARICDTGVRVKAFSPSR
ncbi:DUF4232 domain-containing protein [Streptomyces sp. NPDC001315]|uniref:DUF4232 domain-containing protein n=1 Tax=Streptomyces sp. NPDC001315 TaxID=3364562 RepID=UPI00369B1E38